MKPPNPSYANMPTRPTRRLRNAAGVSNAGSARTTPLRWTSFDPFRMDNGQPLRRPDGRNRCSCHSLAPAKDCRTLYWQGLTCKTLYRLPTHGKHLECSSGGGAGSP